MKASTATQILRRPLRRKIKTEDSDVHSAAPEAKSDILVQSLQFYTKQKTVVRTALERYNPQRVF